MWSWMCRTLLSWSKENDFYYDAVLWAVENGITNGYGSSTIFNPDGSCTRGEAVTFLYRALA